jgi:hypothetical protein
MKYQGLVLDVPVLSPLALRAFDIHMTNLPPSLNLSPAPVSLSATIAHLSYYSLKTKSLLSSLPRA